MNISIYRHTNRHEAIDRFLEYLMDRQLKYLSSDLVRDGLIDFAEMNEAVNRAMGICKTGGMSLRIHFKAVYTSQGAYVFRDWRLSSFARKLVLLNADPSNPVTARMQLRLIGHSNGDLLPSMN